MKAVVWTDALQGVISIGAISNASNLNEDTLPMEVLQE